jgi:hypothetical protein
MMLAKIISGGQTGVDRAALDSAMALGIPVGGWCPKGRLSEDGRIPDVYPLIEMPTAAYPPRTHKNVVESDATLLIVDGIVGYGSRGSQLTVRCAREAGKPLVVFEMRGEDPADVLRKMPATVRVLNVAGNREGKPPFVYAKARAFLDELLPLLLRRAG